MRQRERLRVPSRPSDLARLEVAALTLRRELCWVIPRCSRYVPLHDRATYQGFLDAFQTVERVYTEYGSRKVPEETIPLRLEIDAFFSWVRHEYTKGDSYVQEPLLQGPALDVKVRDAVAHWHRSSYRWFDEEVVPDRYPRIVRFFGTSEKLTAASYDDVLSALGVVHSFNERLRFFKGGQAGHVAAFRKENTFDAVKRTLSYLLYGTDEYIVRMGRCIFDPNYTLNQFGRSAVQELLGWINTENIPVCNSRTLRSLRWLGFDVVLVDG